MAEELDTNIHTYTHTEKVIRGNLPSYATRDEEFFFRWKTKKKRLSATRFARLITSEFHRSKVRPQANVNRTKVGPRLQSQLRKKKLNDDCGEN